MLVTRGTTRSESVFSMGSCPAHPIFILNRVHEISNYVISIPIVVGSSQLIGKLLDKWPILIL